MTQSNSFYLEESSFRDPSGFVFYSDGVLYRQINDSYGEEYEILLRSGLYDKLIQDELLVSHEEVEVSSPLPEKMYKIIKPSLVPFVSYPYEWSFSQLKDAALITLEIQKKAFSFGMSLKDASSYNIQFKGAKPVFIDTLSFEKYQKGKPWVAYKQFCQHFLAPLALMGIVDFRLGQMLKNNLDGVPLDLASTLLSPAVFLKGGLLLHVYLHSKAQNKFSSSGAKKTERSISEIAFCGLIDSLESAVRSIKKKKESSEWGEYYQDTNYGHDAFKRKKELVSSFLDRIEGTTVWDLGANNGMFSQIAAQRGFEVVSIDGDLNAVENNYLANAKLNEGKTLPLFMDLMNPSSDIGWANQERMSLKRRGPADCVLFLALIHHLAISNNVPMSKIAEFLSSICRYLVVEFIPKEDSQVQKLLSSRVDIFSEYSQDFFEKSFSRFFVVKCVEKIEGSERVLYLMERIAS